MLLILINTHSVYQKIFFMFFKLKLVCLLLTKPLSDHSSWEAISDPLYILFGVKLEAWSQLGISTNCLEIGILYGADGGVTETRSDHNRVQGSVDNLKYSGIFWIIRLRKMWEKKEKKGEGDSNHGPHLIPRTPSITIARRSTHGNTGNLFWISLGTKLQKLRSEDLE